MSDNRFRAAHVQRERPRIENRNAGGNEFCNIAGDHDEILQGCHGGDEQIRLSEGVAAP
ncbi:MAG: hypothetical protein ACJ8D0_05020 [Xanthobacteraceae bacterium]